MVKTSHFGSNRSYGLAKAILLYSDGQEAFATVHEPKNSPDGGAPYLDAGEPLTVDFLRQLAKGLGQTVAREILPANVLARTPDMMVWWTRQQHRMMFFSDSSDGRTLNGTPVSPTAAGLQSMRIGTRRARSGREQDGPDPTPR